MKKLYITTGSAFRGDNREFTGIVVAADSSWEAEQKATEINRQRLNTFLYFGHQLTPMDELERSVIERISVAGYERWVYVVTARRVGDPAFVITSVNGVIRAVDEAARDKLMASGIEENFPPHEGWTNRRIAYLKPFPDDVWREVTE